MTSVAVYVRLSKEDQEKIDKGDDSKSIVHQKSMLKDYCADRNWDIYDIYCDEDYSGADRSRPEFNRLINDCKAGKVNIVLCKSQSRFTRDMELVEKYIHNKFIEWGIRFIGIVDNVDTNIKGNKKSRQIAGLVNEWYLEDTSINIRQVLKHKREKGEFTGSFAPYGYVVNREEKKLYIDKNVYDIVKKIFELYNSGWGYKKIAVYLNKLGILSPAEYKLKEGYNYHNPKMNGDKKMWTVPSIRAVIQNETYTGTLVQGKTHPVSYKNKKKIKEKEENWIRFENSHEAIISKEEYLKAKNRFSNNTARVQKNSSELFLFAGKVKCAVCGNAMKKNIRYTKSGEQRYSLICSARDRGYSDCTNKSAFNGTDFEKIILDEINNIISEYCNFDDISLINQDNKEVNMLSQTIKNLEKEKADYEQFSFSLYKDKMKGILSDKEFQNYKQKFTEEQKTIANKIKTTENEIEQIKQSKEARIHKFNCFKKYKKIDALNRDIINDLIDCIYIEEKKENEPRVITIEWNF